VSESLRELELLTIERVPWRRPLRREREQCNTKVTIYYREIVFIYYKESFYKDIVNKSKSRSEQKITRWRLCIEKKRCRRRS
jgi:hypothetical protein